MSVFITAAEEGSLVAAARRHGLSASMAGKHISAIEAEMKVRLMQRSTRSLSLTEAGQAYLVRCKRIVGEYEEALREAAEIQRTVRGTLRVTAPVTYATLCLRDITAAYMHLHPHVVLEVILNDRYVDIVAEGIDVAIRIGTLRDSDLVAKRLAPCPMMLCVSPERLKQVGPLHTVAAVRQEPRLAFSDAVSPGGWTVIDADGRPHEVDGPVRLVSNNMEMILAAALRGTGVAYGPSFVFDADVAAGRLVVLLPDHGTAELTVHAVYPTNRHMPLKLRSFLDLLTTSLKPDVS